MGVRVTRSGKNGEGVMVIFGVEDGGRVLVTVREGVEVGELSTSGVGEAIAVGGRVLLTAGCVVGVEVRVAVEAETPPMGGSGVGETTPGLGNNAVVSLGETGTLAPMVLLSNVDVSVKVGVMDAPGVKVAEGV